MKVLVVDDEDDIRRIAALSLLRLGGMEVVEASGGEEAIGQVLREKPDVILLDVMMPSVDGPATLTLLRNNPATADIPVIFLTAKTMRSEVDRLTAMGAAGVLAKPFEPSSLPNEGSR